MPDRKFLNCQIYRTFHVPGRLNAHNVIVDRHVRYEPQTANCVVNSWYRVHVTLLESSGRCLDMVEQFSTMTATCNMNMTMTVLH
jgi:hypothetical protein